MQFDRGRTHRQPTGREQHVYTDWSKREVNNMAVREHEQSPRVMSRAQRASYRDGGANFSRFSGNFGRW